MRSTTHVKEEKMELAKDVHRLSRLGVGLMDSTKGRILVAKGAEQSFVSLVNEKQDKDPIFLKLKVNFS